MRIHDNSLFSDSFKARLTSAIERGRPGAEAETERRHELFLKGHRFYDTERVCYLGCGMLVNKHEAEAPTVAESLDDVAVDALAMDTLVESASCDHWYTYEKDYGVFEEEIPAPLEMD